MKSSEPGSTSPVIGRFAPSPTGPLHFGSLVAAVGSYCLARRAGGQWRVRIEDLDAPRVVPGAADDILRTLEGLGLTWDGTVVWQSQRGAAYEAALARLREEGRLFPCACSRKEILASAPHAGEEGPIYPGTCRDGLPPGRSARAWRLRVPDETLAFTDGISGPIRQNLASEVGDFVLKRADGLYAYQLAVVVDDGDAGVTQVVRGADLLGSTPRQIYLQRCLGLSSPAYFHLPLVLGEDGAKLSKRHGGEGFFATPATTLAAALAFLGHPPPSALRGEAAAALLAWGVEVFDPARIAPHPRQAEAALAVPITS